MANQRGQVLWLLLVLLVLLNQLAVMAVQSTAFESQQVRIQARQLQDEAWAESLLAAWRRQPQWAAGAGCGHWPTTNWLQPSSSCPGSDSGWAWRLQRAETDAMPVPPGGMDEPLLRSQHWVLWVLDVQIIRYPGAAPVRWRERYWQAVAAGDDAA